MFFYFLVETAKRTWKVLRQQFKLHFDKLPVLPSGSGANDNIDVEWPYFKSLMFLKDIFEKRPTTGNLDEPENTEVEASNNEVGISNSDDEEETQINEDDISSPPTPSSQTSSSVGQSTSRHSAAPIRRSSQKHDRLGYRKRPNQVEVIGKSLLDLEKEKMQMKKAKEETKVDKNDEDVAFFTSLLPHVRKLQPDEKLAFRIKVQQLLIETAYGRKAESNQVSATTPSSFAHEHEVTFDGVNSYAVLRSNTFDYM